MSLIVQPFYFANCTDNLGGTPTAGATGTDFTPGASNADGTAVELLPALSHDVHRLVIGIACQHAGGDVNNNLADILVDPAGGSSWSVLVPKLICGSTIVLAANSGLGVTMFYDFPLGFAAGSSIGIQGRTSRTTTQPAKAAIWAYGNPSIPAMWWYGTAVEALGVVAASSKGADVAPGASGSFGSWIDIGSPSTQRYGAVQFGMQYAGNAATGRGYHCEIGSGDARLAGSPATYFGLTGAESGVRVGHNQPIFCDIAASTQMQMRAKSSGTAPDTLDGAIYGVY